MAADTLRTLVWLWHQGGKVCLSVQQNDGYAWCGHNAVKYSIVDFLSGRHRITPSKKGKEGSSEVSLSYICCYVNVRFVPRSTFSWLGQKTYHGTYLKVKSNDATLSGMPSAEQEFTFKLNYECFCRVSKRQWETRGREGWMTVSFQFPGAQCPNRRTQR